MADQFSDWDMFARNYELTKDPRKALRWTRFELWAEKRKREFLEVAAEDQVARSLERSAGKA